MREKDIMTSLTYLHGGHPYFVSLYCTFQDPTRLCKFLQYLLFFCLLLLYSNSSKTFMRSLADFAMTYAKNGDLLTYLHRLGSFDEDVNCYFIFYEYAIQ